MCASFLLLLFKKTLLRKNPTYFEEQYFLNNHSINDNVLLYRKQSFNFPFPEQVVFDSEKLDIFSLTSKKFRLFNRNL